MKSATLYISDMDGTLLGSDSRISERSAKILNGLADEGVVFTVATARTPATVVPLMSGIRTLAPAIVMTGTSFWNHAQGRFFCSSFIPGEEIEKIIAICDAHGISPFVYVMAPDGSTLDVYHTAPTLNTAEASFHSERANLILKRFHIGTPPPERVATHTVLFYAMGPRKNIEAAFEVLRKASDCTIQCYPDIFNQQIYNLEVFPPGVDKAQAVLRLKEHVGADRVVVFGDNLNDLTMLGVADLAVAVGNAFPQVKEAADIVIEPNYTDSVARFVAHDAGFDYLTV